MTPEKWAARSGTSSRPGKFNVAPASTAPPVQAPLGNIGLTPGYTPNYKDLILHDPSYLSYQNNATLDVNQAAARRKAALQALVVRYGGVGGLKDTYGDIDQTTQDLASRNEFSDTSRIKRNYDQGVEAFKKGLSARGGLSSGDLGYGLDQADYARGASEYDLGQEFQGAAQMAVNDYLGVESGARQAEPGAIAQAEGNVFANPQNRPTAGTEGTLVPDWEKTYGVPVYKGPDGSLWTIGPDGNPIPYTPSHPADVPPAPAPYLGGGEQFIKTY
jgi:hypothetical protein